ncbi:Maf family protein [Agitococcus lubricus]|uniref:Nucleoside triphosphate pyrophosphatase n=1 Tax=Agitococcus lubricus TaxID=1077255 RepID=A0A2T5IVK5_9GAMM|nr:Maf family nucleotide pyrophosphatase [Agitococcus lubricus]PTQ87923.1 septum formation protein [Agitococcus lubricus]
MSALPLVLASSSESRRSLLARLGIEFSQDNPACDESQQADENSVDLALRLAMLKAKALANKYPCHLLIGSDQVADFRGQSLGKPLNHDNAVTQLRMFSGHAVDFYTGLALFNSHTQRLYTHVSHYRVYFRPLSTRQIERYLQKERPYHCAGSFKSEGLGICLFEKFEGDDPSSLVGLPLMQLVTFLQQEGYFSI